MDGADGLAIAGLAASIGVGLILAVAGAAKLRHAALMEGVVANYRILPPRLVAPVARALPYAELVVGAALMAGIRPWPQGLAIALLLGFAAAMAINIRRGRTHIDCGCGLSALRQPLDRALVARNLVLAAMLLPARAGSAVAGMVPIAVSVAGGVALFLFYLVFNAIGALSHPPSRAIGR
ncbi:MAG: methylamine utilization protein MauE [Sphingomonas taxi]|uniref:Methylamine utilization protein MauE n=1 Tax=Sphingomonas taxi TaxID=1549858 RepID=A0A2W5P509_9SPHN|nr:MAG: methylamine utilization protein MauE [Sphingomonas taxi]